MKCVYSASLLLNARLVVDQLEHQGIHAEIFGGYLQGGAGELPASGLIRVMVAEEDEHRAARIVAEWERTTTEQDNEQLNASRRARALAGFSLGLVTGIAGTWLFFALPDKPRETLYFDFNGDHREDGWVELVNGERVESRRDRDFDGRVDAWWQYRDAQVVRARRDDDFDGHAELVLEYKNNQPETGRVDTDDNGVAEMRLHYRHGLLAESEILDPDTGRLIRRLHYQHGRLPESEERDTTGNGVADTRIRYNRAGEPVPPGD